MIPSNGDKPKRAALFITSQRDFFLRQFDEFIKPLTYFSPAATYFKMKMFDQNESVSFEIYTLIRVRVIAEPTY